jgi:hypothetical protein
MISMSLKIHKKIIDNENVNNSDNFHTQNIHKHSASPYGFNLLMSYPVLGFEKILYNQCFTEKMVIGRKLTPLNIYNANHLK